MYSDPKYSGADVLQNLVHETRIRPRKGWVKADQANSIDDMDRQRDLMNELHDTRKKIEKSQRELRDPTPLVEDVDRSELADGDVMFYFQVSYNDKN